MCILLLSKCVSLKWREILSLRLCNQPVSECSLSYAKIMQTSVKKACFSLPECSLSYAKIIISPNVKALCVENGEKQKMNNL